MEQINNKSCLIRSIVGQRLIKMTGSYYSMWLLPFPVCEHAATNWKDDI